MTTYFTAPDGHDEPALWVAQGDLAPAALIRRCDLGPMAHHWDELVARVIAGNPDRMIDRDALTQGIERVNNTDSLAAAIADRTNELANKLYDLTRTPSPPSQGLMQVIPVDRRLEHIQGQIIANGVVEAEFRGRLDRAVGEAWAAGYREAEYERNQAE